MVTWPSVGIKKGAARFVIPSVRYAGIVPRLSAECASRAQCILGDRAHMGFRCANGTMKAAKTDVIVGTWACHAPSSFFYPPALDG